MKTRKPRITFRFGFWVCYVPRVFLAVGYGNTPMQAYEDWKAKERFQ